MGKPQPSVRPGEVRPAPSAAEVPPASPFSGPLESALRHPFLVILSTVLLLGAAAAVGLTRDPVYSSEARVSVGRVDVPAYTLQGVIVGNSDLAVSYARAIGAQPVVDGAARSAKTSVAFTRAHLSASPVPGSTLIQIESEGDTRAQAVALANGAAQGLIDFVTQINTQPDSAPLLGRYRSALAKVDRAQRQVERARRFGNQDPDALQRAQRGEIAARLAASTIGNQYRSEQGTSGVAPSLRLIVSAVTADSDRSSVFQRLLFIGLVAGVLLGLALALLRANRRLIGRRRA